MNLEKKIRTAEPSDIDGILRVERECFDQPDVMIIRFCGTCETFLVCEVSDGNETPDDEIAGYVLSVVAGSDAARVLSIAVLEEYRRESIATQLLKEVFSRLRERDITNVFLEVRVSNESAKSLYRELGFEVTGRKSDYYADGEDAEVMEKKLTENDG